MSNSRDISNMKEKQVAQAWVKFKGNASSSPLTEENGGIRDAYNVSSVTDNGTGLYTVNFDKPFANDNWVMATSGRYSKFNNTDMPVINLDRKVDADVAMTTSSARIACCSVTATPSLYPYVNSEVVFAVFFGELS